MTKKLKSCPFCGRGIYIMCDKMLTRPLWNVHWIHDGMEERREAIRRGEIPDFCVIECVSMMLSGDTEENVLRDAEDLWNRRFKESKDAKEMLMENLRLMRERDD